MKDLLLNDNHDLAIANGDLVVDDSDVQHQDLLLMTTKGEWKESPTIGVGVLGFLKDEDAFGLLATVKAQFEMDGMRVRNMELIDGSLQIDATYGK